MKRMAFLLFTALITVFASCKKETTTPESEFYLNVRFQFDENQARLDNLGQPAQIPAGNAGVTPLFNGMSTHYIELAPNKFTLLGDGEILYKGEETTTGGDMAVDFSKATVGGENEVILRIPLSQVAPGTYEWVRSSLTYQNYEIPFRYNNMDLTGTIASFVGFNTYISDFTVDQEQVTVNANKKQGFWAFEVDDSQLPFEVPLSQGQAPEGATTVPNPLFDTSPIPQGSCVVTGQFSTPFTITGNETQDINLVLSVSIKESFEFTDPNGNGLWEPRFRRKRGRYGCTGFNSGDRVTINSIGFHN